MELLNYDLGMPAGPSGLLVAAHTTENLPRIILTCMVTYAVTLAIYRFYLHPLRAFPGPRLAAFTFWYEFYYDVILGGQYIFQIRRLHERYGPIVRINPHELHIYTPKFYDELFAGGNRKRDKWYWAMKAFGADESTFGTTDHDNHRSRRAALNPFFSITKVRLLQNVIQDRADALVARLEDFQRSGAILHLDTAFAAYTADVIMEYAFSKSDHKVEAPDFDSAFHQACVGGGRYSMLMKQFPLVLWAMKRTPQKWLLRMNPEMTSFVRMHTDIARQVQQTMELSKPSPTDIKSTRHLTIFQEILDSRLPPHEKALGRLAQEGGTVVGAGTVTTAWAITVAVFHLLAQPRILRKLKDELDSTDADDLLGLERLPYLSACIQEGLRLSYGVSSRLARVARDESLTFTDPNTQQTWIIPPKTPVSMSALLILQNPSIFPEPNQFRPERWIENPGLDRYQVVFSKGSRACLGKNLAYAEMMIILAAVFRRFGSLEVRGVRDIGRLELFETTAEGDIECHRDAFLPLSQEGSKGVRARVWPVAVGPRSWKSF
ncbi:cytochrome P450 [Aspergillus tubingensis]|uniref:cytochrome P450 n=1 Tax=Aspergillus tubingensis TaxID=5068 RepID=UPI0015790CC1|nr:cytochrome P450 [Aspergillus tubingensis]GFN16855.1 cytochrome P450 [Aspergillus tubingensis]GLA92355.1 hypothetical protein AtubIFM57143_007876 [Aspergillus tubingensis]